MFTCPSSAVRGPRSIPSHWRSPPLICFPDSLSLLDSLRMALERGKTWPRLWQFLASVFFKTWGCPWSQSSHSARNLCGRNQDCAHQSKEWRTGELILKIMNFILTKKQNGLTEYKYYYQKNFIHAVAITMKFFEPLLRRRLFQKVALYAYELIRSFINK